MKITTWNINSVRLHLPLIERLAADLSPDVICLQETKVVDDLFPAERLTELGYIHQTVNGMKSYNGVAILSRLPLVNAGNKDWCGRQDCRHVFAELPGGLELHNFYFPSGGDVPDPATNDKFAHKLQFLDEVTKWCRRRRNTEAKRMMVGDFNIAPLEADVWSHKQLVKVVSHTPIEVERLDTLAKAGPWTDAIRHLKNEDEKLYSWWSYRARDWSESDRGRRLDHIWVTAALEPHLRSVEILREARGWEKPSDHVPVTLTLNAP